MAFPSNTGTKKDGLSEAWVVSRQIAAAIKGNASYLRGLCVAGTVLGCNILSFVAATASHRARLQECAAVPGIGAFAQQQVADGSLDIAAEFGAMTTAIDGCVAWIVANFPKDGSGYLLSQTLNAQGAIQERTFSAAQTAGLVTQLDALIGTIN